MQAVAPKIHGRTVLLWLEKGSHIDPMSSQWDNLHEGRKGFFVKDKIISNIPNSPYQSAHTNSNATFIFLSYPI
jgi:hypothetical protein